jgi:hypothetical protein
MKVNTFIEEQDRIMAQQGIPSNKRAEYSHLLEGFCNQINGTTRVVEEAIAYVQSDDIKGPLAVKYIDEELEKHSTRLNQGWLENLFEIP